MLKVAITGNIACGKSLAFKYINKNGFSIIDCDDIVKELYNKSTVISAISKKFPTIVNDNLINLKALSKVIFSDAQSKIDFENIIFPFVKNEITEFFIKNHNEKKVFVVVPLLFESGFDSLFDKIILISANEELRINRLIKRKSLLSTYVKTVIKTQIPEENKIEKCDYIISNNGTITDFEKKLKNLLNIL